MQEAVGDRGETMKILPHYDLIIIGGGPAGQGAAEFAAFAGRRTLVIERKVLGGPCGHNGRRANQDAP